MTSHRYSTLLVAALAAAFFGAAFAQTQSDDASRMPAKKGMAQESQTQPSTDQTDKMKAQGESDQSKDYMKSQSMPQRSEQAKTADQQAMKTDQSAKTGQSTADHSAMAGEKTRKGAGEQTAMSDQNAKTGMKHGARNRHADEVAKSDDKAYRDALRDCVKQQDQSQRDSCLDNAIEKFHRNA